MSFVVGYDVVFSFKLKISMKIEIWRFSRFIFVAVRNDSILCQCSLQLLCVKLLVKYSFCGNKYVLWIYTLNGELWNRMIKLKDCFLLWNMKNGWLNFTLLEGGWIIHYGIMRANGTSIQIRWITSHNCNWNRILGGPTFVVVFIWNQLLQYDENELT